MQVGSLLLPLEPSLLDTYHVKTALDYDPFKKLLKTHLFTLILVLFWGRYTDLYSVRFAVIYFVPFLFVFYFILFELIVCMYQLLSTLVNQGICKIN